MRVPSSSKRYTATGLVNNYILQNSIVLVPSHLPKSSLSGKFILPCIVLLLQQYTNGSTPAR
jgi:hypothetical protein